MPHNTQKDHKPLIVSTHIENRLLLGLLRLPVAGSVVAKQRVALWRMRLVGL
jgi:hypothetical protein